MEPMFNPSLMCMDLLDIKNQTEILNERCDLYHVDIMDGHFVKNITLSPDFVKAFSTIAKKPIDCHLMVTDPDDYIEVLAENGAGYICPHAETINTDAFRIMNKIEALGCKKGVVLNPATPLSYIREMLGKIREAKELKEKYGYKFLIEIDGSCNQRTFKELYEAGAEVFIVGSSGLFSKDKDLKKAWDIMREEFRTATGA